MSGVSRAPTNNGAVQLYTGRGYKKTSTGENKYFTAAIVEGGNEASFVLGSSFDIFHVCCE